MRETCARVLAAALMTGAIATALGLPAAFESAGDQGRGLTAPPSSLQRTVRVPAATAPERPDRAERLVVAHPIHPSASRSRIVRHLLNRPAVRHTRAAPRPPAKPKPEAPAPEPRELASTTPETSEPTSPPAPRIDDRKTKKGKGHGKAKGHEREAPPVPVATSSEPDPAPAELPAGPDSEQDHGQGQGHGNDHGKGRGHNKAD